MITVTALEAILLIIVIVLFGALRALSEVPFDIMYSIDLFGFIGFSIALFCDDARDIIDDLFDEKSWKAYTIHIITIILSVYFYWKYTVELEGITRFAGTVILIAFYILYVVIYLILKAIDDKTDIQIHKHSGKALSLVVLFDVVVLLLFSGWNVGYDITRATITEQNNIAYHIICDNGVSMYYSTDGYNGWFGYHVTSGHIMSSKDMKVCAADVEQVFVHKGDKSFTAVNYNGETYYVESDELITYYYDEEGDSELTNKRNAYIDRHYKYIPRFIAVASTKLYKAQPFGSLYIEEKYKN